MKIFLFTLFSSLLLLKSSGQTIFITKDNKHIFWQPNVKLSYSDFRGDTTTELMNFCRKYNLSAIASVGIWSVLDVPKRNKNKKLEKVYFAPVFFKLGSIAFSQDTMQIAMQAMYFDICEYAARLARIQLEAIQDTVKSIGTLYTFYPKIEKEMQNKKLEMFHSYTKDVIIDKKPGSYESWRRFYDDMLDKTKHWATKPAECYRLLTQKPIDPDYK